MEYYDIQYNNPYLRFIVIHYYTKEMPNDIWHCMSLCATAIKKEKYHSKPDSNEEHNEMQVCFIRFMAKSI